MSLTALLLTTLFSFLVDSAKIGSKIDRIRSEINEREYLQMRLHSLLSSVSTIYTQTFPKETQKSLVAVFDHGIDPDPLFSGSLICKIYLDEKKNLSLVLWPKESEENLPWRKEILLTNVSDFEFEFLSPKLPSPSPNVKKEKTKPISPSLEWRGDWPKSRSGIPSIVRLYVKKENEPLYFAFHLPSAEPFITYKETVAK